jgi:hypothetical protein
MERFALVRSKKLCLLIEQDGERLDRIDFVAWRRWIFRSSSTTTLTRLM